VKASSAVRRRARWADGPAEEGHDAAAPHLPETCGRGWPWLSFTRSEQTMKPTRSGQAGRREVAAPLAENPEGRYGVLWSIRRMVRRSGGAMVERRTGVGRRWSALTADGRICYPRWWRPGLRGCANGRRRARAGSEMEWRCEGGWERTSESGGGGLAQGGSARFSMGGKAAREAQFSLTATSVGWGFRSKRLVVWKRLARLSLH